MKHFTSSIAVLQHLVKKRKIFDNFSSRTPDMRELFEIIGNYLQMDELTLMCTIGDYMNIPVLKKYTDHFTQFDTPGIPKSEQEHNAFALLCSPSGAGAVACLEPAWLKQYPHHNLNGPLLLCGWQLLKDFYHANSNKNHPPIQIPNSKITDQISLDNILRRLAFLGVNEGIIQFSNTEVRYEIIAPDLNTYKGVLYPVPAPDIEKTLLKALENLTCHIHREISGSPINITVHSIDKHSFRLTWTPLPETLQIQNELNELFN